jgi:hypothetical protein
MRHSSAALSGDERRHSCSKGAFELEILMQRTGWSIFDPWRRRAGSSEMTLDGAGRVSSHQPHKRKAPSSRGCLCGAACRDVKGRGMLAEGSSFATLPAGNHCHPGPPVMSREKGEARWCKREVGPTCQSHTNTH